MAGRGPAPKTRRSRDRDNPDFRLLRSAGHVYGKPLPRGVLPEGETWHRQTLAMWASLRRSPLLADEPELGWQFLIDTALMHHTMWTRGRWEFASEVRLRLAKFGATPEDRQRLKVQIEPMVEPGPDAQLSEAKGEKVTDIRSRRARLRD